MARVFRTTDGTGSLAMLQPLHIDPDALYEDSTVVLTLDIPSATLARARREGRLRYSRRGRRTYYLGRWLLDWLTGDRAPAPEREVPA
jgi:hypothetical protein